MINYEDFQKVDMLLQVFYRKYWCWEKRYFDANNHIKSVILK
jgi:hypothetical protein